MVVSARHRTAPARRGFTGFAAVAFSGFLALVSIPPGAFGQDRSEPTQEGRAKFAGRIYLASSVHGAGPATGVISLDPNDGSWRKISDESPYPLAARISPDGSRLALNRISPDDVDPGLWISKSSEEKEAVRISERRGWPCWAPDGQSIILTVSGNPDEDGEHWQIAADGSAESRLPIRRGDRVLDWSSDGKWLLVRRGPLHNRAIFLMHPDGTGERQLLASTEPVPEFGGQIGLSHHFSPDGRTVLLDHTVQGGFVFENGQRTNRMKLTSSGLLVMGVDGGRPRRFLVLDAEEDGFSRGACWSPDGKAIAVVGIRKNDQAGTPLKHQVELVDNGGNVLGKIPLAEQLSPFGILIDWR